MDTRNFSMLRSQLYPSERLIWSGYPCRGIHLRFPARFAIIVFPLAAAALVALMLLTITIARNGAILVFVVIWYMVLHSVVAKVIDALRRRKTFYGLTQRRAIIVEGDRVRSIHLASLADLTLSERADQAGTIRGKSLPDFWYRKNNRGELKPLPIFHLIVDARHVHDLILDAQRQFTERSA